MSLDILVAPTEPPELRALGVIALVCEDFGADYLWAGGGQMVGVQRKTITDLLASLEDGRLAREAQRLSQVDVPVLLLEGRAQFTSEGFLLDRAYRRESWAALLMSMQFAHGIHIVQTETTWETGWWLRQAVRWFDKAEHTALVTRPKATNSWGDYTTHLFQSHLLQSFPGVGPELAQRIINHFGAPPLQWTVTEKELRQVEGIGKERARQLVAALKEVS